MVESLAPKGDEPIGPEEVINIGEMLSENYNNPAKALQLLKVLDRKKITAELLENTKIGKKLAPIVDTPNPENEGDVELIKELSEMKVYLKKKWMHVYKKYKKLKSLNSEELKDDETPKNTKKFDIPYMPNYERIGEQ